MTTQFISNDGGKIAYDEQGSGPLVVCVPSMGDVRQEYRFLRPILVEAGYRVAAMDVRGHGESSTEWTDFSVAGVGSDVIALARQLGGGKPVFVIGTSMAAGAAVWAAAHAPGELRGMVLIGPFVRGGGGFVNNVMMRAMFSRPWGPAAWKMYYSHLYPTRQPQDFAEYTARLQDNLAEHGRLEALMEMLRASKAASEQALGQVGAPALVLMGSKDPDFPDPAREAQWVAQAVRGEFVMLPGAGHYPQAEFPAETAAKILPFLKAQAGEHVA